MKKLALALALSSTLLAGQVMAQDNSHGITVYGRLETAKSGCTVLMSKYVLNLNHRDNSLPVQGSPITTTHADDHIYVQLGGENCDAQENYSKIGLKFIGTADNVEANTLANIDTGSTAAKGVSVQLSDVLGKIITPNVTVARFRASDADDAPTTLTASYPVYFALVNLKNQEATPGNIQTNLTVQIERL